MYEDILQDVESKEVIALGSGGIYGVLPVKDRSGPKLKSKHCCLYCKSQVQ